jgi:hypothetical protein
MWHDYSAPPPRTGRTLLLLKGADDAHGGGKLVIGYKENEWGDDVYIIVVDT